MTKDDKLRELFARELDQADTYLHYAILTDDFDEKLCLAQKVSEHTARALQLWAARMNGDRILSKSFDVVC